MRCSLPRPLIAFTATLAAALTSVVILAVPAPASGSGCTYGSSNGNTQTCIYANGNGAFVSYMQSSAHIVSGGAGRVLQSCLHEPSGARIGCTPYTYEGGGGTVTYTWAPHNYVTSGYYCAETWRQNNDGSTTQIGRYCVLVQ